MNPTQNEITAVGLAVGLLLYAGAAWALVRGGWSERIANAARPFAASWPAALAAALVPCAAIYLALITHVPGTGDAAMYNTHIEAGALDGMPVHWGHYAYGMLLLALSPFATDLTMNLGAALAALLAVAAIFALTFHESDRPWLACVIAAAFGTCAVSVLNGIYTEVYMPQTAACVGALWLHRRGQSFLGGALYAYALTISVASCVFAPLFLLPPFDWLRFARAVGAGVLTFGLFVGVYWEGLFYGDRGLLTGGTQSTWTDPTHLMIGWAASAKQLVGSFPFVLPWVAWSVFVGLRQRLWSGWVAAVVIGTLLVHAVIGGAGNQWGFDLIVTPLVLVPLAVWLASPGAFPNAQAQRRAFALVAAAVAANGLMSASVWPQRSLFGEAPALEPVYQELGRRVGHGVLPLGTFDLIGLYQRANERPYTIRMSHWRTDCPLPGDYVVLDRRSHDEVERAFGKAVFAGPDVEIEIDGQRFWRVRLREADLLGCRENWADRASGAPS